MKILLTITMALTIFAGFGQISIKKSSISTDGNIVTRGNITVLYTIGEVVVQEKTIGNIHLSEGFIGPDLSELLGVENYGQLQAVQIYPNPVQTNLYINVPETQKYELYLYDLNGKQLLHNNIEEANQSAWNLSKQKTGIYLLIIIDRIHQKTGQYKIQKL